MAPKQQLIRRQVPSWLRVRGAKEENEVQLCGSLHLVSYHTGEGTHKQLHTNGEPPDVSLGLLSSMNLLP